MASSAKARKRERLLEARTKILTMVRRNTQRLDRAELDINNDDDWGPNSAFVKCDEARQRGCDALRRICKQKRLKYRVQRPLEQCRFYVFQGTANCTDKDLCNAITTFVRAKAVEDAEVAAYGQRELMYRIPDFDDIRRAKTLSIDLADEDAIWSLVHEIMTKVRLDIQVFRDEDLKQTFDEDVEFERHGATGVELIDIADEADDVDNDVEFIAEVQPSMSAAAATAGPTTVEMLPRRVMLERVPPAPLDVAGGASSNSSSDGAAAAPAGATSPAAERALLRVKLEENARIATQHLNELEQQFVEKEKLASAHLECTDDEHDDDADEHDIEDGGKETHAADATLDVLENDALPGGESSVGDAAGPEAPEMSTAVPPLATCESDVTIDISEDE